METTTRPTRSKWKRLNNAHRLAVIAHATNPTPATLAALERARDAANKADAARFGTK